MEFLLWLLALVYVYIFLIYAPSIRIRQAKWFKRYYAHRGLFDEKIVENSLEAFQAAVEAGYGIELDVQCTLDGEVVVFHDASLKRLCSNPAVVGDTPYQTLQAFRLLNTRSKIPTLKETLDCVSSKVPLIIEIKHSYQRKKVVKLILDVLNTYPGPFSICSFDPFIVRQVK
ncbi:MAG: glycerophosphodiester phosphodiesterase family protein [Erysipelotrichaceae bacterium]